MDSLINWWQYLPHKVSPTIFTLGSFQLRYYGMMYIVAFALTLILMNYRSKKENLPYKKELIENFVYVAVLSILIGGRLGYVLFYNFNYYLHNPLEIILPFDLKNNFKFIGIAGMSYHGAVIGAISATWYFCRKHKLNFWHFADFVAICAPLGYTFGRIGNFMNGELYGRVTDSFIGMYFLTADGLKRHPSQLYEAFGEGIVLFTIMWLLRKKNFGNGFFLGFYIAGYGLVRFLIEFVREPDEHLGFILSFMTMGQLLCTGMMIVGGLIIMRARLSLKNK